MNSRSGCGPAPEPGKRRVCIKPGRRHDAHRFDEIVDMRVERRVVTARSRRDPAAQASRTRNSAENGASVKPCGFSCASRSGPSAPAWMRAARLVAIDLHDLAHPRHVERDRARIARRPRRTRRRRHTLDPPPNGMTAAFARVAQSSTREHVALAFGIGDDVGRAGHLPLEHAHIVGKRLAVGMHQPLMRIARAQTRDSVAGGVIRGARSSKSLSFGPGRKTRLAPKR